MIKFLHTLKTKNPNITPDQLKLELTHYIQNNPTLDINPQLLKTFVDKVYTEAFPSPILMNKEDGLHELKRLSYEDKSKSLELSSETESSSSSLGPSSPTSADSSAISPIDTDLLASSTKEMRFNINEYFIELQQYLNIALDSDLIILYAVMLAMFIVDILDNKDK